MALIEKNVKTKTFKSSIYLIYNNMVEIFHGIKDYFVNNMMTICFILLSLYAFVDATVLVRLEYDFCFKLMIVTLLEVNVTNLKALRKEKDI